MTTTYIDVNAQNADIKNKETNASWVYKLKEPIVLPANSEVAALSSFVNFKGIVGQAIDIKEEIVEEIVQGYYVQDTFYEKPRPEVSNDATAGVNTTLEDAIFRLNYQDRTGQIVPNVSLVVNQQAGFTENMLPVIGGIRQSLTNTLAVPLTVRIKIVIPKGVYSVQQIAQLITEQMNGKKIFDLGNKSSIETMIRTGNYRGIPSNNTMSRVMGFQTRGDITDYANQPTFADKELSFNTDFFPLADIFQFGNITDFSTDGRTRNGGTPAGDPGFLPHTCAVRPRTATRLFDFYKRAGINKLTGEVTFSSKRNPFRDTIFRTEPNLTQVGGTPHLSFGCIVNTAAQADTGNPLTALNDTRQYCAFFDRPDPLTNLPFNIYDEGYTVGTTEFQVGFSTTDQLFTIQGLSQLRKEPTNDNLGNEMPDPSKIVAYERRISNNIADIITTTSGTATPEQLRAVHSCISKPMRRLGGTYVYNWGYATAKKLRTNFDLADTTADDYRNFQDFFNTEDEAKKAWESTLWFRLGFQYDQLQATESWGTSRFFMDEPEPNNGFTTDSQLDDGAIPFVSTMYSNQNYTQPTDGGKPDIPADEVYARPNVNNLQVFTMMDVNIPSIKLKNNRSPTQEGDPTRAGPTNTPCVFPYNGSFFTQAVMLPIITQEIPVEAAKLPQLSEDGYLIITSPTFQNNDQISKVSPVCLLDILPLSALSNQDFVSDKNELVHKISNELVINHIEIRILRPDLTEPILDSNSSVLLRITLPDETVPQTLSTAAINLAENEISETIIPKKDNKKEKKK